MEIERNKEKKENIEIEFGQVFAFWFEDKCSLHVIIDVGSDNWFETSQIVFDKNVIRLSLPGTASPENIHLMLGKWSKEQIIRGFENYFEEPLSENILNELNANSLKSSRVIKNLSKMSQTSPEVNFLSEPE